MTTRVDQLLAAMTLKEKCGLTTGLDMWSTKGIERLGIPPVGLTDGPNGARGPVLSGVGTLTSMCVPSGTALGASWDPGLVREVGAVVGQEAITKGCRVLLAPTVNIHRAPLAGRNFECISEDPLLTGAIASGYVQGAQGEGVACTVKHFVGNEAEFDRATISSEIDERTLREIYLRPFEMVVETGVLGVMTGYNRLNGTWCAEHPELLSDILRTEWGYDGFVVSDWGGIGSTVESMRAGLDLEMPGPGTFYGDHLLQAIRRGDLPEGAVDVPVRRLLGVMEAIGALDDVPSEPQSIERDDHREVARRASAASMVLLRNEGVLPFRGDSIQRVAVIGPNAEVPTQMGGGAAFFKAHRRGSIIDAVRGRFPGAEVRFEPGVAYAAKAPPLLMGLNVKTFAGSPEALTSEVQYRDTQVLFPNGVPGTDGAAFRVEASGTFHVQRAGTYHLTLVQLSDAVVSVDGEVVVDGVANTPLPGKFPWAPQPLVADVELAVGEHHLQIVSSGGPGVGPLDIMAGFTLGFRAGVADDGIQRAASLAAESDAVLLLVGTDSIWETEAVDRPHMDLPGDQDALIEAVCSANPNTVVVLNVGSPVTMPWAERAPSILVSWFGGQEMPEALLDVIVGDRDPGGRLPTTFPLRLEHTPSYGTFPGENGVLRYGEGVFVGYRWYDSRKLPVAFAFGHGLSYTTFAIDHVAVELGEDLDATVTCTVTNTGSRRGSEVVQCYLSPPPSDRPRPDRQLVGFAKVAVDPGESRTVEIRFDRRGFARWNPALPGHDELIAQIEALATVPMRPTGPRTGGWVVDPGTWELQVGRSLDDITHRLAVEVTEHIVVDPAVA